MRCVVWGGLSFPITFTTLELTSTLTSVALKSNRRAEATQHRVMAKAIRH